MRLGAVTVCVHESDSLAATLPNRDQFDHWLIITPPSDRDTIAFCHGRGLECRTSEALEPRGGDPLGEPDRVRAIEEGRAALGPGWTATISSYVLLPRWFRACIEAEALDPRRRYFLEGFRRCTNRRMAERLKWCEPWRPDAAAPAEAERLFALSHLGAAGSTDGPSDRLAMTALLLGEGALAWGAGIHTSERLPDRDLRAEALREVLAELVPDPSVLVAGCYPGMKLELWAQGCARIFVSDDFGLHGNAALCARWQADVADLANLTALDAFNAPTVPDHSVDLLYLPGEASAERLIAAMPFWRRVLKRNALVCGDLYGWADWQAATQAVAQVFGAPDRVAPSGFWQRRYDPAWLPEVARDADGRDVIILDQAGGDPERVLVSLHALRQHWRGPVTVERADPADDRIALACARYGATLRSADAAAGRDARADRILLRAGTLVTGPLAGRFAATATLRDRIATALRALDRGRTRALPATIAVGGRRPRPLSVVHAATLQGSSTADPPALVWYDDENQGTDAARDLWFRLAGEMRAALTPPVRMAADSTIAVIIEPDRLAEFERNWPTWNFGAEVPVLALCAGVAPSRIRWVARKPHRIEELTAGEIADPRRLMQRLLKQVATTRIIVLPPSARSEPGATLLDAAQHVEGVVLHSTVEVHRVNGGLPLPWPTEPLLIALTTDHARKLCAAAAEPGAVDQPASAERRLKAWLHAAIAETGDWALCNVERWGWRLRPAYRQEERKAS